MGTREERRFEEILMGSGGKTKLDSLDSSVPTAKGSEPFDGG